jgi:8-oxo-dGTP diphosphatase
MRAIQRFEVSLKGFVISEQRVLLLQEADTGFWELPGGRIDVGEERIPHSDVLSRELSEELGPDFKVDIGHQIATWVRQRPTDQVFQFICGRVCRYRSGVPTLSGEHKAMAWTAPADCVGLPFPPRSDYPQALAELWRLAALP